MYTLAFPFIQIYSFPRMFVGSVFSVSHITIDKAECQEIVQLVVVPIVYSIPCISCTRVSFLLDQFL